MLKQRNYWVYSIGCFLVWGILLVLAAAKAKNGTFHNVLLVFAGWTLCWVSATMARLRIPTTQAMATTERIADTVNTLGCPSHPDGGRAVSEARRSTDVGNAEVDA